MASYFDEEERKRRRQEYLNQWQAQQTANQQAEASQNDALAAVKKMREQAVSNAQSGNMAQTPTAQTAQPITYDHALASIQKMRKNAAKDTTYDAAVMQNVQPVVYGTYNYPLSEEAKRRYDLRNGLGLAEQTIPEKRDTIATYMDGLSDKAKEYLALYEQGYLQSSNPYEETGRLFDFDAGDDMAVRREALMKGNEKIREARKGLKDSGYSDEEIDKLLAYQRYISNYENNQTNQERIKELLNSGNTVKDTLTGLALSAKSILGSPLAGISSALSQLGNKNEELGVDTYGPGYELTNYSQNVQRGVRERINPEGENGSKTQKALEFAYGGAYSAVESAYGAGLSALLGIAPTGAEGKIAKLGREVASLLPMGMNAYSSALQSAQERGVTGEQAQQTAAVAGIAEVATEILSLDKFWDIVKGNSRTARKVLMDLGASALIEGSEEAASDIINRIADRVINGDTPEGRSEYAGKVREYMAQGLSEEEANKAATKDWWLDVAASAAGGAFAGGLSGGIATVANAVGTDRAARATFDQNTDYRALADNTDVTEENYTNRSALKSAQDFKKAADALAQKQANGEKITNKEIRNLYWLLRDAQTTEAESVEKGGTTQEHNVINQPDADYYMQRGTQKYAAPDTTLTTTDVTRQMAQATTAAELVQIRKQAETSQNPDVHEIAAQAFDMNKGRILSQEGQTEQDFDQAEQTLTTREAWDAGMRGLRNIDKSTLSQEALEAYNEGLIASNYQTQQQAVTTSLDDIEAVSGEEAGRLTGKIKGVGAKAVALTENGQVEIQNIENSAVRNLYDRATKQGTELAEQAYLDNYAQNMPIGAYDNVFNRYFRAAATSTKSFDDLYNSDDIAKKWMSKDALQKIYDAGIEETRQQHIADAERTGNKIFRHGTGLVIDQRSNKDENVTLQPFLESLAKLSGVDIVLDDSVSDRVNGFFEQPKMQITLNTRNSDARILNTAWHETAEFVKANAPEQYQAIQQSFMSYFAQNDQFMKFVGTNYQQDYSEAQGQEAFYEAMSEAVNDGISGIFSSEEGINDYINHVNKTYGEKAKDILRAVADYFKRIADSIRAALSGGQLSDSARYAAQMDEARAREIRKQFLDAIGAARENAEAREIGASDTEDVPATLDEIEKSLPEGKRFSLSEPVEQTKDLLAVHNLTIDQLLADIALGGLPSPSIAIIRAGMGHSMYGDVSLVFDKDTIDPKLTKKNKVYSQDAWTPTFPTVEYKLDGKKLQKIRDKVSKIVPYEIEKALHILSVDEDNASNIINQTRGDAIEAYANNETLKYAYLKENGIDIEIPTREKRLTFKYSNDDVRMISDMLTDEQYDEINSDLRTFMQEKSDVVEMIRHALNESFRNTIRASGKSTLKLAERELYPELSFSDVDNLIRAIDEYRANGIEQEPDTSLLRDAVNQRTDDEGFRAWLADLFDGVVVKKGLRNNKSIYTDSGNRRSWDALHDEFTLENIVKIMNQEEDKGAAAFWSQSAIQAISARDFRSIDEIRKAKGQLKKLSDEEYKALKEAHANRFEEIASALIDETGVRFVEINRAADSIADAMRKYHTASGIEKELKKWHGDKAYDGIGQDIVDLRDSIASMPTGYFEAKPKRAVWLDEVKYAVIPDSTPNELIKVLDDNGIVYKTYAAGDEVSRQQVMDGLQDVRFSLNVDSEGRQLSEGQDEYFKDSKVRDIAGNLMVMYHGTPTGGFTVFRNDLTFFSPDREYASKYEGASASARKSGKKATSPQTYKVYLNIKHPFDIRDPKIRKQFINEYVKGGYAQGINPYTEYRDTTKTGLPDWTEADNIYEWMEENDLLETYDGIVVDEGGYPDDKGGVADRGIAYITFNPNQIKNVDNLTPTSNPDIRYSLQIDSEGNNLSEDQERYFADSKIRDENGNLLVMYHGSRASGFNVFDRKLSRYGFYFTDNLEQAQSYSGNDTVYDPNRRYSDEEIQSIAERMQPYDEDNRNGNRLDFDESDSSAIHGNYKSYLNITDPLEVDAAGANWMRIPYKGKTYRTDALSEMAEAMGKDGLLIRNVEDYGGYRTRDRKPSTVVVAFRPEQIKDVRNTKPTDNPDIRYSRRVDSEGNDLSREQMQYFQDSKVRDDQGNLLRMYHGTHTGGFSIFDAANSDDGRALFFSADPGVSSTYANSGEGGSVYPVYLNVKNPLVLDANGSGAFSVQRRSENPAFEITWDTPEAYDDTWVIHVTDADGNVSTIETTFEDSGVRELQDLVGYSNYEDFAEYLSYQEFPESWEGQERHRAREINADNTPHRFLAQYEDRTTRGWAKWAQAHGYDGVIFKNIIDVASHRDQYVAESTVVAAFDSNQVKSVFNKRPTGNPDIRYSLTMPYQEFKEDAEKHEADLEIIQMALWEADRKTWDDIKTHWLFADRVDSKYVISEGVSNDDYIDGKYDRSKLHTFNTFDELKEYINEKYINVDAELFGADVEDHEGDLEALNKWFLERTLGDIWINVDEDNSKYVLKDKTSGEDHEFDRFADLRAYVDDNVMPAYATSAPVNSVDDSEGNRLTLKQQAFFKNSKVRDAEGRLKVMYHGTQYGGFTVFDPTVQKDKLSLFFVDSPYVAETYSASNETILFDQHVETPHELFENLWLDEEDWDIKVNGDQVVLTDTKGKKHLFDNLDETRDWLISNALQEKDNPKKAKKYHELEGNYEVYVNIENPLEIYANDVDWKDIWFEGKSRTTRDISEIAYQRGYDGVIFHDLYDLGGFNVPEAGSESAEVVIAFNPSAVKSTANENPTDNVDIRFSLYDPYHDPTGFDSFLEILEEQAQEQERAAAAKKEKTSSILADGLEALKTQQVDEKVCKRIAVELLKKYGSTYDVNAFAGNLQKVFAYAQETKSVDYDDLLSVLYDVAEPVIEASTEKVGQAEYNAFKKALKGRRIALTNRQMQEVKTVFGSYALFKRAMPGVTFTTKGTPLDSLWSEIVDASGGVLDLDVTEGDMPIMLYDALQALTPSVKSMYGEDLLEVSGDLAMEIVERYFSESAKTAADATVQQRVAKSAEKMRKRTQEYREKVKARYDDRLKKEREALRDKYRTRADKLKADQLEKLAQMRAKNKEQAKQRREREAQREEYAKIKKEASKLYRWASNPTEKHHIINSMIEPIMDFLSTLDLGSPRIESVDGGFRARLYNPVTKKFDVFEGATPDEVQKQVDAAIEAGRGSQEQRKWKDRMRGIKDIYTRVKSGDQFEHEDWADFVSAIDPDLADGMDRLYNAYGDDINVSQMSSDDMKTIKTVLRNIVHAVNQGNEAFSNNSQTINDLSEGILAHAEKVTAHRTERARRRGTEILGTFLKYDNATPETFFHMLGKSGDQIYKSLTRANNRKAFDIRGAQEYMIGKGDTKKGVFQEGVLKGVSTKDLADWTGEQQKIIYEQGSMKLSVGDVMYLYVLMKREAAEAHKYGGFEMDDKTIKGKEYRDSKPHMLSDEMILEITEKLTDEQKRIADAMQKYLAVDCSEQGNEVSRLLYGYDKYVEANYVPMSVDKKTTRTSNSNVAEGMINSIKNQGFTKALVPNANNPLIIRDMFEVFAEHVANMATYHAYAPVLSDIIRIDNYKTREEIDVDGTAFGRQHTTKEALEDIGGKGAHKYLVRLVQDINQAERVTEVGSAVFNSFVKNYKAAATLGNLRVVAQQPTAWFRAAEVIDPKWLTMGLAPNAEAKKLQEETSAISWIKSEGNIDGFVTHGIKKTITGAGTMYEDILDKTGWLASKADDVTWAALYRAVYAEQADKFKGDTESQEFKDAVNDRFDELIARTQVVDGILMRSQLMRSTDRKNISISAFMGEPTKSYNMFLRDYIDIMQSYGETGKVSQKALKHLSRTFAAYLITNIVNAVMQSLSDAKRDEDESKTFAEKFLEHYGINPSPNAGISEKALTFLEGNLMDDLNMFNNIPGIDSITEKIWGVIKKTVWGESTYSSNTGDMDLAWLDTFVTAFNYTFNKGDSSKVTLYGTIAQDVKAISQATGIPIYNVMREIVGAYNTLNDLWGGRNIRRTKPGTEEINKPIFDSIDTGKDFKAAIEDAVKRGGKYDSIEKAITAQYKEEYIALRDAGNLSEATQMENRLQIIYDYLDKQEGQKSSKKDRVRKWYEDELKKRNGE